MSQSLLVEIPLQWEKIIKLCDNCKQIENSQSKKSDGSEGGLSVKKKNENNESQNNKLPADDENAKKVDENKESNNDEQRCDKCEESCFECFMFCEHDQPRDLNRYNRYVSFFNRLKVNDYKI